MTDKERDDACPCNECAKQGWYCDYWDTIYCCEWCEWTFDGR